MEGIKLGAILIIGVLFNATNINAKQEVSFVGTDNKIEGETVHELKKLESCASKCKPEEKSCAIECVKKSLAGASNFKLSEAKYEMIEIYQSIFCLAGCGQSMTEICDKKDAENCKKACKEMCITQPDSLAAPATAPTKA